VLVRGRTGAETRKKKRGKEIAKKEIKRGEDKFDWDDQFVLNGLGASFEWGRHF